MRSLPYSIIQAKGWPALYRKQWRMGLPKFLTLLFFSLLYSATFFFISPRVVSHANWISRTSDRIVSYFEFRGSIARPNLNFKFPARFFNVKPDLFVTQYFGARATSASIPNINISLDCIQAAEKVSPKETENIDFLARPRLRINLSPQTM